MTANDSKPTIVVIDIAKGDVPGCTGTGTLTLEETGKPGQRTRRLISAYNVRVKGVDGPGRLDIDGDGNVRFMAGAAQREDGVFPPFMHPGEVPWWFRARGRQGRSGMSYSNNVGNVGSFNSWTPGAMPGMSTHMGPSWAFGPGWNPMAGMHEVNIAMGAGPSRSKHGSGSIVMVNSNSGNVNSIIGSNNAFSTANVMYGPPGKNPKKSNRESFINNKGNVNSFNSGPAREAPFEAKKGKQEEGKDKGFNANASVESFDSDASWSTCDSNSSESTVRTPSLDTPKQKYASTFCTNGTNGNVGNVNSFNQWGEESVSVHRVATSSAEPVKQSKVEIRPQSVTIRVQEDVRDTPVEESEARLIEDSEIVSLEEVGCWSWFPWWSQRQAKKRVADKRAGKGHQECEDDTPPSYEEVQAARKRCNERI
ncbi:unnamed protein product [Cyclocybe aegerita]|uniref:Uncharacterized protein n=1 Tax=Cyclocybe aegerita TaxID=1973307 RepID=A0A8S0W4R8_CYCAE|nr:unnamed protein product [Cyclocybe aegerita]